MGRQELSVVMLILKKKKKVEENVTCGAVNKILMSSPSSPLFPVINFKSLGPCAFLKAPQMFLLSTEI